MTIATCNQNCIPAEALPLPTYPTAEITSNTSGSLPPTGAEMNDGVWCDKGCVQNEALPMPPYPGSWSPGIIEPPPVVAPIVTALVPPSTPTGGTEIVLEVQGSKFESNTVILWNGEPVATTYVSSTALRTTIQPAAVPHSIPVSARTGDLTATNTLQFQYTEAPVVIVPPEIVSVTPDASAVGALNFTASARGLHFTPTTQVLFDGVVAIPQTYISETEIQFTVSSSVETVPRTATVTVQDGATAGTGSVPFAFVAAPVVDTVPVLTALHPAFGELGNPPFTVRVEGSNFVPTSQIYLNGVGQVTTYVSPVELQFLVERTGVPRSEMVAVKTGGLTSETQLPFTWVEEPVITSTAPDVLGLDDPPTLVRVYGRNFTPDSIIIEGTTRWPTTFISDTELHATIDASGRTTAATVHIRVLSVTGVVSKQGTFSFWAHPVMTEMIPDSAPIGAPDFQLRVSVNNPGPQTILVLDGVDMPTVRQGGNVYATTVSPSLETAPRTMEVDVRVGHIGHPYDDVRPLEVPLVFTFTAERGQ
jgi:hypothetical protein